MKELTRFGGWSSLYGFSSLIRKAADPIILNRWSTPLDVTCFHLGSLVPSRLEVIINQSLLGAVSPVVVGLNAEKQNEKLKNLYLRLGRFAMWGVLLVIAIGGADMPRASPGRGNRRRSREASRGFSCFPIAGGDISSNRNRPQ